MFVLMFSWKNLFVARVSVSSGWHGEDYCKLTNYA